MTGWYEQNMKVCDNDHNPHLKAWINQTHELLNRVVQGRTGHSTAVQNCPGLIMAIPEVDHLAGAEHVCLVEEGADVC